MLNIKWPVVTMKYGMLKREKTALASLDAHVLMNHMTKFSPLFSLNISPTLRLMSVKCPEQDFCGTFNSILYVLKSKSGDL
jgi:hypothetical protein